MRNWYYFLLNKYAIIRNPTPVNAGAGIFAIIPIAIIAMAIITSNTNNTFCDFISVYLSVKIVSIGFPKYTS